MASILIVDDDPLVRESLELELLEAGFEVSTSADGMSALRIAQDVSFDLVLCDIRMPGIQGLEVLAQLKAANPRLRTIVMTGYASPDTPIEALRLRIDDYLMKPFDGELLLHSIGKLLAPGAGADYTKERSLESFLVLMNWITEHAEARTAVGRRVVKLAEAAGCEPARVDRLYLAALLAGAPERFCEQQSWLNPVMDLWEKSNENWDGSGALGLRGEQIPLEARLLAVALERPHQYTDPSLNGDKSPELGTLGVTNLLRLAEKHLDLGRASEAESILERASSLNPREPELQVALGRGKARLNLAQGQSVSAVDELLRMLKIAQDNHLQLTAAELALKLAEIGPFPHREEALKQAVDTFQRWEREQDRERAQGYLSGESLKPAPPARTALEIQLFGGVLVRLGQHVLDDDNWVSRKDRSLFAFLSYQSGKVIHEDKLVEIFWGHSGDKARHSLHNAVSKIRKALQPLLGNDAKRLIQKKRDGYVFGAVVPHRVDVVEFSRLIKQDDMTSLRQADELYRGEFLQGSYESWIDQVRWDFREKLSDCRYRMAEHFTETGKPEVARDLWERVLEHDSCHEGAYLELMRCCHSLGKSADAIKAYHRCVQALKEELDLGPPAEVVQFYLELIEASSSQLSSSTHRRSD